MDVEFFFVKCFFVLVLICVFLMFFCLKKCSSVFLVVLIVLGWLEMGCRCGDVFVLGFDSGVDSGLGGGLMVVFLWFFTSLVPRGDENNPLVGVLDSIYKRFKQSDVD